MDDAIAIMARAAADRPAEIGLNRPQTWDSKGQRVRTKLLRDMEAALAALEAAGYRIVPPGGGDG